MKGSIRNDLEWNKGMYESWWDGSSSKQKTCKRVIEYLFISFTTGSKTFANELSNFLNSIDIKNKIHLDSRRKECKIKTYYIKIQNKYGVKKFYNYIYEDATIYLQRKKDIFDKYYSDDIVD